MALTQKELNLLDELSRLNQRLEKKLMALERTATPKPLRGSAKRAKARAKRQEAAHAKQVRAQCVERDGYCLIATQRRQGAIGGLAWLFLERCDGPSEWAHVGQHRRCHTRGQSPEQRHTTSGSAMLCQKHHDAYDRHVFDLKRFEGYGADDHFHVVIRRAE